MPFNSFDDYPMSWRPSADFTDDSPIYRQLAAKLTEDISAGILTPGTRLPPQRELADFLDISLSTVSKALKLCEARGLVSSAHGEGTYISSDIQADPYLLPSETLPIDFGNCHPSHTASSILAAHLEEASAHTDLRADNFQYRHVTGTSLQRAAGAKFISYGNYEVSGNDVLLTGGCQNALLAALCCFLRPGDCIGTTDISYAGMKSLTKMLHIQEIPLACGNTSFTEQAIRNAVKTRNMKALFLEPEFQTATACTMPLDTRKMIARLARELDLLLIEDAVFAPVRPNPLPALASFAPERTVYVTSLSKVAAPGWRIGYAVVPRQYYSKMVSTLYTINFCHAPFIVEAASTLIFSGDVDRIIRAHRQETAVRNQQIDEVLGTFQLSEARDAMYRWVEIPDFYRSGLEFEHAAARAGVEVFSAERFVVGKADPPKAFRMATSTSMDEKDFFHGLYILKNLLQGNPKETTGAPAG